MRRAMARQRVFHRVVASHSGTGNGAAAYRALRCSGIASVLASIPLRGPACGRKFALRKTPPSGHPAVSSQGAAPTTRWPASADPRSRHGVAKVACQGRCGKIATLVQISCCCSCSCCLSRIGSKRDATELHGPLGPVQRQFLALGKGIGPGQIDHAIIIRYQHEVRDRTRSSLER